MGLITAQNVNIANVATAMIMISRRITRGLVNSLDIIGWGKNS